MRRNPLWFALVLVAVPARGADPPPALTVRLVHPDRQGAGVLALFEGARSPHPAAALAAWKRATGETLGKPREALIALVNPAMSAELKTLNDASFVLSFAPEDGRIRWRALLPHDDGTVAALATALVLTDGASAPPLGDAAIDRLGPPGAPLMLRKPGILVLAGTRADLEVAFEADSKHAIFGPKIESGCLFRLNPEALGAFGPALRRQAAAALRSIGGRDIEGVVRLAGETLSVELSARPDVLATAALDPTWFDWVPDAAAATVAIALDPRPEAWDRAFAAADRIERADPARAGLAPLRTRLNLLALAAKVRPEVDLWPALRGVSAALLTDQEGAVAGGLLILHTVDPDAAERLTRQVIPRLIAPLVNRAKLVEEPDGALLLGVVAQRPLRVTRRETTILIGWGDRSLREALDARAHPDKSAGAAVRAAWGSTPPPHRAGALWPGRLGILVPAGSPLALALKDAPPVLWSGRNDGRESRDDLRWTGFRGLVKRFLERLPLDPPVVSRQ